MGIGGSLQTELSAHRPRIMESLPESVCSSPVCELALTRHFAFIKRQQGTCSAWSGETRVRHFCAL